MRYYKYDTQYLTYDILHNELGYTRVPTEPVEWLSTGNSTYSWGDSVCAGYSHLLNDFTQCSNFAEGIIGWFDLNTFAITYSLYPSQATNLEFVKNNIYSSGASLEFNDTTRFLIEKDIEQGWITEDEYLDLGWRIYEEVLDDLIFVNDSTGKVVTNINLFDDTLVFTPVGYYIIDVDNSLIFLENDPYYNYVVLNSETGDILSKSKGHELETVPIPACTLASPGMECVPIPAMVLESPEMVVYVPTAVELPTVTDNGDFGGTNNWFNATLDGQITPISPGSSFSGYFIVDGSSRVVDYDSTKSYAIIRWQSHAGENSGRVEFQCVNNNGNFGAQNVTSGTLSFSQAKVAVCSSNQATVVPVYDSSNNAYNAFKYTTNNTDYYYVLDGTQTDWTDDLSSIGYSLSPEPDYLEIFFYLNNAEEAKTFGVNDYWGSAIIDQSDKSLLENFGVNVSIYGTAANSHHCVSRDNNSNFSFQPVGLYSGLRTGALQADMSNFYCAVGPNNPDSLYYGVCIWSQNAYSTLALTWKCRITRINGGN